MVVSGADKQRTLAYAATASLAAVTLVYVFGPTWFIDSDSSSSNRRRKGVVGLVNTANDCFINSILQALAGLEELRTYLVTRTHSAKSNGELIRDDLTIEGKPFLTAALKEILDRLNERPISRKTISAAPFLAVLEGVFQQRISRSQQDAHEFLQVVAETLAGEYHRAKRREKERQNIDSESVVEEEDEEADEVVLFTPDEADDDGEKEEVKEQGEMFRPVDEEGGVPFEGRIESEIECLTCGFKPKPTVSTFVVLTLPVPLKNSTTLTECIEGALSSEYIDDYACAKCRLTHAIALLTQKLSSPSPPTLVPSLETAIDLLTTALNTDPEQPPPDVPLPPINVAPRSRIVKRTRMSYCPPILTLHLSRSIYDPRSSSRKNSAKVGFLEKLEMGGLAERRGYRLICVVTHKGGHESGHYECFRRQVVGRGPYATSSSNSGSNSATNSATNSNSPGAPEEAASVLDGDVGSGSGSSTAENEKEKERERKKETERRRRKVRGKLADRWWRISDDKVKEARTADVLGMQKEVYLLFYERDRGGALGC
ncbi:hypothetical protein RUND412_002649 [Rhizina undulata]